MSRIKGSAQTFANFDTSREQSLAQNSPFMQYCICDPTRIEEKFLFSGFQKKRIINTFSYRAGHAAGSVIG
jgi:hypothetical protein